MIITAGFDKSAFAICVAELLKRSGIEIAGIIVVNPINVGRLLKVIRKNGFRYIKDALPRLLGKKSKNPNQSSPLLAFQNENNISENSLKKWAKLNNTAYKLTKTINHLETENFIKNLNPDYVIYGGGGIIRNNIIEASNGSILNAHLGPLPEIRGMNAIEWAVLLNEKKEITIHFIDQGIDTGESIESYKVIIDNGDTIETIREKAKVSGIKGIVDVIVNNRINKSKMTGNKSLFRQCFVLSNSMRALLQSKLNNY